MTLTVGRASFARCPSSATQSGNSVTFDVEIRAASLAAAKVSRQQVLGLIDNPDEPVVPVTWSDDPDYDGFYRVRGVQVEPVPRYLTRNRMLCSIDLERVRNGYARPTQELYGVFAEVGALTVGDLGSFGSQVTAPFFLPSTATTVDRPMSSVSRTTSDGSTIQRDSVAWVGATSGFTVAAGVSFVNAPADQYRGACTIEQSVDGTWYPVVGNQIPANTKIRLTNGLVRFTVESTGELTVESWDGVSWRAKSYDLTFASGSGTIDGPSSVVVNRNSIDATSVTFVCPMSDGETVRLSARVHLGSPIVEMGIGCYTAVTWKVTRATIEAATALQDDAPATYGVRATANDANGHRYVIVTRAVSTADATNGGLTLPATSSPTPSGGFQVTSGTTVGFGMEITGSSAVSPNNANAMGAQFQVAAAIERTIT